MQWKSPAGRLERKARPRSGSPGIIAGSAASVRVVSSIGVLDILTVGAIVTVTIIVTVNRCPHDGAHLHRRRHQSAARIVVRRVVEILNREGRAVDIRSETVGAGTFMPGISPGGREVMNRMLLMVPTTNGGAAAERAARSAARDAKASAGGGGGGRVRAK